MRPACCLAVCSLFLATGASAAPKPAPKPAAKPAPKNEVKGQGQLAGASGQFGMVYSLQNGFNFAINAARYSVEPYNAFQPLFSRTDEKLFIVEFAVKNVQKEDRLFNPDLFTAVDAAGNLYEEESVGLTSRNAADPGFTLRPGQGAGQPEMKDPLRVAWRIPAKARIVKVMVNSGRVGKQEEVLRYYLAGATKEEAGEAGDPKNVVAALPEELRDPADATGGSPLAEAKGKPGVFFPTGYFTMRLDGFAFSSEALLGEGSPEEDKRFAVATVTARSQVDEEQPMHQLTGSAATVFALTDADGETVRPVTYLKAKRVEDPEKTFKKGDEYQFRILFTVPKGTAMRKLLLGAGEARVWAFDVSAIK
jgi:hypothetical protein